MAAEKLPRTISAGTQEALRAHNAGFENCVEKPVGSGNFILPTSKKLLCVRCFGYLRLRGSGSCHLRCLF
jgi:hypothetical protein|eukprot:COSAG06_NODE_301_length_17881_cov_19.286976_1_plen_70_part_00